MIPTRLITFLTALVGLLLISLSASAQTRENFTLNGLNAYLITPDVPAVGKPWIAFTPSLPGPGSGEAWMFAQYYAAGIAVAGIDSGDGFGSPTDRTAFTALYNELVNNRGYADKVSFHTRSRGGLLGLNWSADNPDKVAAVGGIYPAHNLLSFPGATTAAGTYGVTVTELTTNIHLYNPIERLAPLAAAGVKLFALHGDSDGVVPMNQNSQITKNRYDALGGDMTLKVIVGGGHDLSSYWFQDQDLTDFMIDETLAAANTVGPPTLNLATSVTPADNATDVTVSSNLVANFSEAIALTGSGTIHLKNLSGGADIPVALPGNVTIAGRKLTINPPSNLVGGQEYAVEISSNAIKDLDDTPNPYAGLLATHSPNWSFTADGTAPGIDSRVPTPGATNVTPSSDLVLTFDEDVLATSGNITLHLASNHGVVQIIPANSGAVTITGGEVMVELAALNPNTSYYVNVASGAFTDPSGNSFVGITGTTTWAFTTGDVVGPLAVTNFSFDDDGTITVATPTGWSSVNTNLGTRTGVGGVLPTHGTHQLWLNGGNTIYQNLGILIEAGSTYTLTVDVTTTPPFNGHTGTLRFYGSTLGFGTAIGGAETSKVTSQSVWTTETVSFTSTAAEAGQTLGIALSTTGTQTEWDNVRVVASVPGNDTTPPNLTGKVPADDATGVAANANIVATFNEAIQLGASGNITLDHLSGGTDVVIDVTSPGGQLSVAGNVLTINPSSDLAAGASYAVLFDAGSVTDTATTPNPYAGISDPATWNFTIVAASTGGPITVANPGFDAQNSNIVVNGTTVITNWDSLTTSSGALVNNVSGTATFKTDGARAAWLNHQGTGRTLRQTTAEVITAGTTYTLTVDVGVSPGSFYNSTATIRLFGSGAGYATALAETTGILPGAPSTAGWLTDRTVTFTATAGQATGQTLGIALMSTGGTQVYFDKVRLTASVGDTTAPTLTGIVDGKSGGPVDINTLVTFTVTFSEDMDASTVSAADFGNAGTAAVTIGTVTETSANSGIFTVPVTPTSAGNLQLQVIAAAVLKDVAGNALVTTSAIADDTTLTVRTAYATWAAGAVFTADANHDGVANGLAWLLGAANPSANASGLLPVPTNEAGELVLTFRCLKTALRGAAVLEVQYTNDLGQADPWASHQALVPDADGTVSGVVFDTTPDSDPAFINVRAKIPAGAASPDGKLFGRLYSTGN